MGGPEQIKQTLTRKFKNGEDKSERKRNTHDAQKDDRNEEIEGKNIVKESSLRKSM